MLGDADKQNFSPLSKHLCRGSVVAGQSSNHADMMALLAYCRGIRESSVGLQSHQILLQSQHETQLMFAAAARLQQTGQVSLSSSGSSVLVSLESLCECWQPLVPPAVEVVLQLCMSECLFVQKHHEGCSCMEHTAGYISCHRYNTWEVQICNVYFSVPVQQLS